jgi:hypothetical protein
MLWILELVHLFFLLQVLLGRKETYFSGHEPRVVLRLLQTVLEGEIVALNKWLDFPYDYLKPSCIEIVISLSEPKSVHPSKTSGHHYDQQFHPEDFAFLVLS